MALPVRVRLRSRALPRTRSFIPLQAHSPACCCAADDTLVVTELQPGGLCDVAGVTVGMRLVSFQGELVAGAPTWKEFAGATVVGSARPWAFEFAVPAETAVSTQAARRRCSRYGALLFL